MHERNPYQTPPDFLSLAESYSPLKSHLVRTTSGVAIDFQDIAAQKCLTQALLCRDFGLELTVPDDRLCPPVPNRLNYILWIEDVLAFTGEDILRPIHGLDVGTGASAIYPLLGCQRNKQWHYIATDIDSRSLEYAQVNVRVNGLENRIKLVQAVSDGPILPSSVFNICPSVDFTMCNPPFYSDHEEVQRLAETKEFEPNAVCTGADTEMITPGGEVAFVGRILQESLVSKGRCRWYSSMLGKMSSLHEIVAQLRNEKVDNYAITEFVQGKTRRWAIAWSFLDRRLPDSVARISNPSLQALMPGRNTLRQPISSKCSDSELYETVRRTLASIEGVVIVPTGTVQNNDDHSAGLVAVASGNTWSRAARRKKSARDQAVPGGDTVINLCCRIRIQDNDARTSQVESRAASSSLSQRFIEFCWEQGTDRQLFESFMSHVSRKVESALKAAGTEMIL